MDQNINQSNFKNNFKISQSFKFRYETNSRSISDVMNSVLNDHKSIKFLINFAKLNNKRKNALIRMARLLNN